MKKIIYISLGLVGFLSLSACIFDGLGSAGGGSNVIIASNPALYEDDDYRTRRGGSNVTRYTNPGDCGEYHSCEEVCEDVFEDYRDRRDYYDDEDYRDYGKVDLCVKLPYNTAIQFDDILSAIEHPDDDAVLRSIDIKAFSKMLDISVAPWVEVAEDVGGEEARALLSWFARESRVSEAIEEAYENHEIEFNTYQGIAALLKEMGSGSGCADICDGAKEGLLGDRRNRTDSVVDIARARNNNKALRIIQDIIDDNCTAQEKTSENCPAAAP